MYKCVRIFLRVSRTALIFAAVVAVLGSCSKLPKLERSTAASREKPDEAVCEFNGSQTTEIEIEKIKQPFRLTFGTRCGPERYSRFSWEPVETDVVAYSLSISSLDFPKQFDDINLAVSTWFHFPLSEWDRHFYEREIVPRLHKALRAPALENSTIERDRAKAKWISYLLKRQQD
ncbi:MAG: hypothetical protein ABL958_10305 [Bdellovibrionia bacterium]